MNLYYKIYKPYGMLSQFTPEAGHESLASLLSFQRDVYPVGRLDYDTDGLLLLTNDKRVNNALLNPEHKHSKIYWVQVEGEPGDNALALLGKGLTINIKGVLHQTQPATVNSIKAPSFIMERIPPVNYKKHPVTSWIELKITEGKNHQVRKMTAKAGHPTLRLIRYAIEEINIEKMETGDVIKIERDEFYQKLNLQNLRRRF